MFSAQENELVEGDDLVDIIIQSFERDRERCLYKDNKIGWLQSCTDSLKRANEKPRAIDQQLKTKYEIQRTSLVAIITYSGRVDTDKQQAEDLTVKELQRYLCAQLGRSYAGTRAVVGKIRAPETWLLCISVTSWPLLLWEPHYPYGYQ